MRNSHSNIGAGYVFPVRLETFLAAAYELLLSRGKNDCAEIVRIAKPALECAVSHDNWNGGIDFHDLRLEIPLAEYGKVAQDVQDVEATILRVIGEVSVGVQGEELSNLSIVPMLQENENWRGDVGVSVPLRNNDRVWEPDKFRVFISHLSKYKDDANNLKRELKTFGVSAFVAHEDIEPTREWIAEIEYALRTAQGFVALMNDGFHASHWTDQEIGFACARALKVVSVLCGETPYGFIGKFQGLRMPPRNLGWEVLKRLPIFQNEAEAYVQAVEKVESYDDAVTLARIQGSLSPLAQEDIDRIIRAAEVNATLRDSVSFWNRTKHSEGMHHYIFEWLHCSYEYKWEQQKYVRTDYGQKEGSHA